MAAFAGLVFPLLLLASAADDLRRYRISNRLTVAMAVLFFPAAILCGLGPLTIGASVLLGCIVLAVGFGMFSAGWLGGGDAKLIAAAVLWTGTSAGGTFLLATVLFGGLLAFVFLLYRRMPMPAAFEGQGWLMALHDRDRGIPYGVAICTAGLFVWPETVFFGF